MPRASGPECDVRPSRRQKAISATEVIPGVGVPHLRDRYERRSMRAHVECTDGGHHARVDRRYAADRSCGQPLDWESSGTRRAEHPCQLRRAASGATAPRAGRRVDLGAPPWHVCERRCQMRRTSMAARFAPWRIVRQVADARVPRGRRVPYFERSGLLIGVLSIGNGALTRARRRYSGFAHQSAGAYIARRAGYSPRSGIAPAADISRGDVAPRRGGLRTPVARRSRSVAVIVWLGHRLESCYG